MRTYALHAGDVLVVSVDDGAWEEIAFACRELDSRGSCVSGAEEFRKPRFAVWIGYDF